jgi:addiction module RelE/StbE family toxin
MSKAKYRVYLTPSALRDIEEITDYISKHSPHNARAIHSRLKKKAFSLETSPQRGRMVPELSGFGLRVWRELIVNPYRIIYQVHERDVYVSAVLDSRRNLEDHLLEKLLREGE